MMSGLLRPILSVSSPDGYWSSAYGRNKANSAPPAAPALSPITSLR